MLRLQTIDSHTFEALGNTTIVVMDSSENKLFAVQTDSLGKVQLRLPKYRTYHFFAMHPNISVFDFYYDSRVKSIFVDTLPLVDSLQLIRANVHVHITFPTIYFKKNSTDASNPALLDSLVSLCLRYPRTILQLAGHCDGQNRKEEKNFELALQRSEFVYKYLIDHNVGNKIAVCSFGSRRPANDCDKRKCSTDEHQMNNRVSVRIIGTCR